MTRQDLSPTENRPLGKWPRRWTFRSTSLDAPLPETTAIRPKVRDRYRWALAIAVETRQISLGASALASMISDKAGPQLGTVASWTHRELGELIGRCPRQVASYLRELAQADLIEWHHALDRTSEGHLRQRPNVYRCMIPAAISRIMRDRVASSKKRPQRPKPAQTHQVQQPWLNTKTTATPMPPHVPVIVHPARQVNQEIPDDLRGLSGPDLARAMLERGAAARLHADATSPP